MSNTTIISIFNNSKCPSTSVNTRTLIPFILVTITHIHSAHIWTMTSRSIRAPRVYVCPMRCPISFTRIRIPISSASICSRHRISTVSSSRSSKARHPRSSRYAPSTITHSGNCAIKSTPICRIWTTRFKMFRCLSTSRGNKPF